LGGLACGGGGQNFCLNRTPSFFPFFYSH
jgi:hypothetical protein